MAFREVVVLVGIREHVVGGFARGRDGAVKIVGPGAAERHTLRTETSEEGEGVIGGFAQALQAEQAVATVERLAAVTDLVVDVGDAPIREDIGVLRHAVKEAYDEGGLTGILAAGVDAVERAAPFVPVELALEAEFVDERADAAHHADGKIGRLAALVLLWAGERRQRLAGRTVVVVNVGRQIIRHAVMRAAELKQFAHPVGATGGRTADAKRGVDALDRLERSLPEPEKIGLRAAPEPAEEIWFVPDFEVPLADGRKRVAVDGVLDGFTDEILPLLPVFRRTGTTLGGENRGRPGSHGAGDERRREHWVQTAIKEGIDTVVDDLPVGARVFWRVAHERFGTRAEGAQFVVKHSDGADVPGPELLLRERELLLEIAADEPAELIHVDHPFPRVAE